MKIAVSLPDALFEAADRLAKRLGVSRSQLYVRALERYLVEQDDDITAALDLVHIGQHSGLEQDLAEAQRALLGREQ